MTDHRPGFFRVFLHSFYDPSIIRDVLPDGAKGAFMYLAKLSALAASVALGAVIAYQYYHIVTVTRPLVESKIKPAFKDSPALSWKDGVLTAQGKLPFRATVDLPDTPFTMIIDTRETPDTADITRLPGAVNALTTRKHIKAERGKIVEDARYDQRFDGRTIPEGQAYTMYLTEPALFGPETLMAFVLWGLVLLLLTSVGALVAGGVAVAIRPETLRLGMGGVWTVAAHTLAAPVTLCLVLALGVVFLANGPHPGVARLLWIAWAAPLVLAIGMTTFALRACSGPAPARRGPPPQKPRLRDDDLLPPDKI